MTQAAFIPLSAAPAPAVRSAALGTTQSVEEPGVPFKELLGDAVREKSELAVEDGKDTTEGGKVLPDHEVKVASQGGESLPPERTDTSTAIQGQPQLPVVQEVFSMAAPMNPAIVAAPEGADTTRDISLVKTVADSPESDVARVSDADVAVVLPGVASVMTNASGMDVSYKASDDQGVVTPLQRSAETDAQKTVDVSVALPAQQLPITVVDSAKSLQGSVPVQQGGATAQVQTQLQQQGSQQAPAIAMTIAAGQSPSGQQHQQTQDDSRQAANAQVLTGQPRVSTDGIPTDDVRNFKAMLDSAAVSTPLPADRATTPAATPSATGVSLVSHQPPAGNVSTGLTLGLPLHHPKWAEGMGERVVWMANQGVHSAELKLNPANLGPIEIRIAMNDGQASVSFSSPHQHVRDAIENALPRLRDLMQEGGLSLGDAHVSDQSGRDQQQYHQAEEARRVAMVSSLHADELGVSGTDDTREIRGVVDYYA